MMENLENLARAAYQLHADIDAKRKELKDIEAQIAAQAVFPEGRKTASTTVGNLSVKVQKTERYKGPVQAQPCPNHSWRRQIFEALLVRVEGKRPRWTDSSRTRLRSSGSPSKTP